MPKFTWAVFELGLCEELSPQRIALRARWRATKPIPSTFPFRVRLADGAGYMECGTNNSSTGFSRRMECGEGVDALRVPPWLPELNAVSTSSEYVAALTSDGRVLEWNIS